MSALPTRLRRGSTALAALALVGLAALVPTGAPAQAAPAGLELVAVKHSLLGTHYWYRQTAGGHPVVGAYYAEHVDARSGKHTVDDGRVTVGTMKAATATVS